MIKDSDKKVKEKRVRGRKKKVGEREWEKKRKREWKMKDEEREWERKRKKERNEFKYKETEREMCINGSDSLLLYQISFYSPSLAIPNNDSKIADRMTAAPIYAGIKINV